MIANVIKYPTFHKRLFTKLLVSHGKVIVVSELYSLCAREPPGRYRIKSNPFLGCFGFESILDPKYREPVGHFPFLVVAIHARFSYPENDIFIREIIFINIFLRTVDFFSPILHPAEELVLDAEFFPSSYRDL